jgi:hypothetical protein
LAVHTSTIRDLIDEWRKLDVLVPTRGAIKDIGPEPSHKRIIADLLARGSSTSQIRAMTKHSEGSIGRYQEQFGMVLYLLHKYPEASDDERCRVADISRKAYDVYVEVYRAVADRPDCRPHLERLRRRYELDPEGLAYKLPKGKAPLDDTSRQRLEQQTLPTSVRQTIQEDLGTTQRVAQAVTDDLMSLIEDSFRLTDSLRPGELVAFVDAHDPSFMRRAGR